MIRDLNRLSEGIDENNQNSARRKLGPLGRFGRSAGRLIGPINTALTLMDLLTPPREEEWDCSGTSWRIYRKCANPNPAYNLGWSGIVDSGLAETASLHGFVNSCLAGQAPQDVFDPWNPASITSGTRSNAIGRTVSVPGPSYRCQMQVSFVRPSTGLATLTPYPTLQVAIPSAFALPALPATSWPITAFPDEFAPLVTPAYADAIPWALVPSRPRPDEEVLPRLRPSRKPVDWSIAITSPAPSADGFNSGKPPRFHDYVPPSETPNPKDKERKLRPGPRLARIIRYLGAVTEAADTVDALYDALPSRYRPRYKKTKYEKRNVSYNEKLEALYNHWDQVDMSQAIQNLIEENVKDRIYGEIGKAGGEVSRRLGHHYGAGINSLLKKTHNLTRGFDTGG